MKPTSDLLGVARDVLARELEGVGSLRPVIDSPPFSEVIERIVGCRGRVVVLGVGKSGHVAQRIAASFRSTGTPAVFLHPTEAVHGDLGLVGPADLAIFFSKSGESQELIGLAPRFRRMGVPVVAVVADAGSTLARDADLAVNVGPLEEAGPLRLVPSTSTTVFQVLGDLWVACAYTARGLSEEELSFLHPGGLIGHQATSRVEALMHRDRELPRVPMTLPIREAVVEMVEKRLGMTTVVDADGKLVGILTDGDIRRVIHAHGSIDDLKVHEVMTTNPRTIAGDALVAQAVAAMETNAPGPITALVVVDDEERPVGVVHLHDCLRLGPTSS